MTRSTTSSDAGGRVPWLDGWRGVAILAVLAGHFGGAMWSPLVSLGGYGVELFFVLSGRLMAQILFVDCHPLPDFFRRRFARIYPALFVFVLVCVVASAGATAMHRPPLMAGWEVWGALTFTMNYILVLSGATSRFFEHLWSISVEEHCYIMLAAVAAALRRRRGVVTALIAVAGGLALCNGLRLWFTHAGPNAIHDIYWRTDVRLAPVFLSAALHLYLHDQPPSATVKTVLGFCSPASVLITLALCFSGSTPLIYTLTPVALAIGLNGLSYAPSAFKNLLSFSVLTRLGLLSYSIYLWQQPLFRVANVYPALAPALVVAALCLGLASYHVVEQPARRWINSIGRKTKPSGLGAGGL